MRSCSALRRVRSSLKWLDLRCSSDRDLDSHGKHLGGLPQLVALGENEGKDAILFGLEACQKFIEVAGPPLQFRSGSRQPRETPGRTASVGSAWGERGKGCDPVRP